jgi:hypothetical protein
MSELQTASQGRCPGQEIIDVEGDNSALSSDIEVEYLPKVILVRKPPIFK